ncbi:MAG TPA: helix-turn-helix domain-containing protein [Rhodanobacteraceae bacterium]|nr:helix-turn-helix domain-containing protein [Rhodanobacteraceae bacterium]
MNTSNLQDLKPGDLLTDREAAAVLNIGVRTLRNWRCNDLGPRWVKIGQRAVRYHRRDLAAFIAANDGQRGAA